MNYLINNEIIIIIIFPSIILYPENKINENLIIKKNNPKTLNNFYPNNIIIPEFYENK